MACSPAAIDQSLGMRSSDAKFQELDDFYQLQNWPSFLSFCRRLVCTIHD